TYDSSSPPWYSAVTPGAEKPGAASPLGRRRAGRSELRNRRRRGVASSSWPRDRNRRLTVPGVPEVGALEQALSDVRVVDLSHHIAGPFCTKLLADYGAEVIKVEPPWGEVARRAGPFPNDEPHPEQSGLFLHLNTNKRGVTLNLKTAAGLAI